jgi:RNA polymerase sigma factor (sigma-70 family)
MHTPDYNTLWSRLLREDRHALFELHKACSIPFLSLGRRWAGDAGKAADAYNDLFLELWERRSRLPETHNTRAYLLACYRHMLLKRDSKMVEWPEFGSALPEWAEPAIEEHIIGMEQQAETAAQLRRALDELPKRQRELLQLRYYEGLSPEQIVGRTGLTTRSVYNNIYEGLKYLRKRIGGG